jgi:hypothetical protein
VTTTLKHLDFNAMRPSPKVFDCHPIAPTMQAIIIDGVPIVDPQLAPIVRNNAEVVIACPADSQPACPTHSKVITSSETRPLAVCVTVIDRPDSASHVRSATVKVLTTATLSEIVNPFHKARATVKVFGAKTSHAS